MSKLTAQELAREFENFVNGASESKKQEFAEAFTKMHNTNMQSAFGVILRVVEEVSNLKYVDARNEISKERAVLLLKGFKKEQSLQLQREDSHYWTKSKADDFVNNHFKISSFPLI